MWSLICARATTTTQSENSTYILRVNCTTIMRPFEAAISGNRQLGHELLERERDCICAAVDGCSGTVEVAAQFNTSQRTVQRTLKRYNETGSNLSKPHSGRSTSLSRRQRRLLLRIARKYPKIEYRQLMKEAELWPADTATPVVSIKTVYRALLTQGLRNFRSKRRPKIAFAHRPKDELFHG